MMKAICALLVTVTVITAIPPIPYPTPERLYSSCALLTCLVNNTCRVVYNSDQRFVYAACRENFPPGNDVCEIGKPLLRYGPDGLNATFCDRGSGVTCPSGYTCPRQHDVCCPTVDS